MTKKFLLFFLLLLSFSSLAACDKSAEKARAVASSSMAQSAALSAWVKSEQSAIPDALKKQASIYSKLAVSSQGKATIVYTFTYKETVDPKAVSQEQASLQSQYQKEMQAGLKAAKAAGISNPKAIGNYLNPDGSLAFSLSATLEK
jgi:hypothetical protein